LLFCLPQGIILLYADTAYRAAPSYLQIADQSRSLIAAESSRPAVVFPAERELAKRFASRPTFREALIALEVEGYVDVRPGSGILVTTQKRRGAG